MQMHSGTSCELSEKPCSVPYLLSFYLLFYLLFRSATGLHSAFEIDTSMQDLFNPSIGLPNN